MQDAIKKDIVSESKYIKDLQHCIREKQEQIIKKKDEQIFHGIILFIKFN